MPSMERVEAFMALVEAGDYLRAIEEFYEDGASMQENGDTPRVGVPVLLEGERRMMAAFERIGCRRLAAPAIDGDRVAIAWHFDFFPAKGEPKAMEEIAWQRWNGDRIAEERFFYDPRQMA